jgi:hypothetical protein
MSISIPEVRQYLTTDCAEPTDVLVLVDDEHEVWHHLPAEPGLHPDGWCNCVNPGLDQCWPTPWTGLLEFVPLTVVHLKGSNCNG